MATLYDDLNRAISLENYPESVVSLVPSITETVVAIGKENVLCGVTRFCVHPDYIRQKKTVVGGTKTVKTDVIRSLTPGLILAEKSENPKDTVEELAKDFPVFVFDIHDFNKGLNMISTLGRLLNAPAAFDLKNKIENKFSSLKTENPQKKALYLIWKNPWMAAGRNTFIGSMMEKAGFVSVVDVGYPVISERDFENAEVILLSTEPFPFKPHDVENLKELYPQKEVILVDGEMFAWYGARMLVAGKYFKEFS